jgi:hypothetical protein
MIISFVNFMHTKKIIKIERQIKSLNDLFSIKVSPRLLKEKIKKEKNGGVKKRERKNLEKKLKEKKGSKRRG